MATRSNRRLEESGAEASGVPPARAPELEDWLNAQIFHPLAGRLAHLLARTPISPNMVSTSGLLLIVAAGALYTGRGWSAVALGFAAHALWHVVDGADGDLARLTGKTSPVGEIVDGVCDYLGHALLYAFLATVLDDWIGLWAWALGWAAGISRAFQSNHAEGQRRTYLWRAYGVPWLKQASAEEGEQVERSRFGRLLAPLAGAYVRVASAANPLSERIDALTERASRTPEGRDRARRIVKEESRIPLKLQTALGANLRTVTLGLSMAAGSPLWFWLAETTVCTLAFLVSVMLQRRCDRRIVKRLEGNAAILGA